MYISFCIFNIFNFGLNYSFNKIKIYALRVENIEVHITRIYKKNLFHPKESGKELFKEDFYICHP